LKIYSPPTQIKQTLCTQPGVTYAPITKYNFYTFTNIERVPHIYQSHQQTSDKQKLKNIIKSLFEQMGIMLNLLTTVFNTALGYGFHFQHRKSRMLKALHMIVDAFWDVPNMVIRRNLQTPTVKEEICHHSSQYNAHLSTCPKEIICLPHS
jgi:hypothetical protein